MSSWADIYDYIPLSVQSGASTSQAFMLTMQVARKHFTKPNMLFSCWDHCHAFCYSCMSCTLLDWFSRYVSLFPLLMGLLDSSSPELGQQLKLLKQPDLLWTPYGLRYLLA